MAVVKVPLNATAESLTLERYAQFLQAYVPIRENDVRFWYHVPRHPSFNGSSTTVNKAIFSITPTNGVYDALRARPTSVAVRNQQNGATVAFIHRPFALDRYRVPRRGGVVLSSHKSLDEVLTTGWNVQLAQKLGISIERSVCIEGYKGDPSRRIGLVGPVNCTERSICQAVHREFGAWEGCFGFTNDVVDVRDDQRDNSSITLNASIKAVALMNAFHPDEIDRVINAASQAGFIKSAAHCHQILYLTGAVRQPGLEAAMTKGIKVICVGHKVCEDWGIRFLATETRAHFPGLEVVEIDEPEEPRQYPTPSLEKTSQTAD